MSLLSYCYYLNLKPCLPSPKYGPLDFGPPLPVTSSKRKEIPIPYYYDYTYRDKYRYKNICAS